MISYNSILTTIGGGVSLGVFIFIIFTDFLLYLSILFRARINWIWPVFYFLCSLCFIITLFLTVVVLASLFSYLDWFEKERVNLIVAFIYSISLIGGIFVLSFSLFNLVKSAKKHSVQFLLPSESFNLENFGFLIYMWEAHTIRFEFHYRKPSKFSSFVISSIKYLISFLIFPSYPKS